ncbi:MAG: tRNA (adenosine(37)-N6)-threonylcarbamoyltransferase complex ATPase subunit type 1 TsaE [Planctomycetota bacterium]|jgi:tRNA threonylcarbamoyladenosine biosynthesis protein TsaE
MPSPVAWISRSANETLLAGERLGAASGPGLFIALFGPLGAGKTVLVKGIARGLGVEAWDLVASPTFTLAGRYEGRLPLLHVDAYRLRDPGELIDLGFEAWIAEDGVTALEWADRAGPHLPPDRLEIRLAHAGPTVRELALSLRGDPGEVLRGTLERFLPGPRGTST